MRVLHVHSGNLYGGVETTLLAQARHHSLCPAMELSFALCFAGRFSEELSEAGAQAHWLGPARVRNPLSIRTARQKLSQLLRQYDFDLAVTHSAWSQAIFGPVVRASKLPLVFCLHGMARGRHWLERWARHTQPDLVLCNSRFTAGTLTHLYPHARAEVVYNPLVTSELSCNGNKHASLRAALNVPEDAVVIVQIGRMEEGKGHSTLLNALSLLKDVPNWICWQIGGAQQRHEVDYVKRLKRLAATLGIAERVRFWGQRSDVPRLLKAGDIYCQPNTSPEGFGHTFIEALMSQLPVVTTAIGGAQEIVDDSCGLLVVPNDSLVLAASLRRLIDDKKLRRSLGEAGPLRARKLCDVSTQMRQLHKSFAGLCL